MTIKEFDQWKEDYGLVHEPNYSLHTEMDCLNAFKAGQRSKQDEVSRLKEGVERLLKSYNNQKGLHVYDEFNRGWVSAFSCVVENLENILK